MDEPTAVELHGCHPGAYGSPQLRAERAPPGPPSLAGLGVPRSLRSVIATR